MAKEWQKILDDFSGSNRATTTSKPTTSTKASVSPNSGTTSTTKKKKNDWQSILDDFSGSKKSSVIETSSVAERVQARTYAGRSGSFDSKKDKKEKRKWYEDWFQKGAMEDGNSLENVAKTILGTASDFAEDVTTGLVNMGELAVDGLMSIAPYVYKAQVNQNGGIMSVKQQQMHDAVMEDAKKDIGEFVKKDLYDANAVAKQILANVYAAAPMANITQNGGQITQADLDRSLEAKKAALDYLNNDMEAQSVLGERSDALVQSAGQLAGQYGLSLVGVPWFVTSGVTSYGGEMENALNQGATYEEATGSAMISAGAEVLSEKIFDGDLFTKGALVELAPKHLASAISNKTLRTLTKLGFDAAGEGGEEVFSQVMSRLGSSLYKEENIGEILFSEEALDEYIESFVGGVALGGGMSGINAISSNKSGVDYATGLTTNEQKVVDKVYKDELAKKDGKVSQKEKNRLYEKVLNDLEKGYISTEDIESALGGETYNQYKKAADWEKSLKDEYETLDKEYKDLLKMKRGDQTGEQQLREAELKELLPQLEKRNKNVEATSTVGQLKTQLSDEVKNLVKNDKLVESYNEQVRTKQKFEADLNQYEAKQRQHIQDAIDSGVLHNGNRAHEIVDFTAKVSADTGIPIKYSNTEKIKADGLHPKRTIELQADGSATEFDLGVKNLDEGFKPIVKVGSSEVSNYTVDFKNGKITFESAPTGEVSVTVEGTEVVDAIYTNDGIILNVKSPKYLEALTGHEVGHKLEQAKNYDKLKKAVVSFAEAKGEWEDRLKYRESTHKGIENANPEREAVNDLLGEYLFQGSDFIMDLSVNHRNVFQKIYDEIKYLCKVATAGSKEARRLEAVKHEFEKAYREIVKAQTDTKYSVSPQTNVQFTPAEIQTIQNVGRKSVNAFTSSDIAATEKFARRYWEEMGTKSPFYRAWFGDWREHDTTPVQTATKQGDTRGTQRNTDTGWDIQISGKVFNETKSHNDSYNIAARPYLPYINDIVEKAVLLDSYGVDPSKPKSPNSLLMHSMYAVADIGNGPEVLKLYVEEMNNPNATNTTKRGYQLQNIEKYRPAGKSSQNTASSISPVVGSAYTVADLFAHVKRMDSNFTPNVTSKIVNADGSPKVMYHGSQEQFTEFDRNKAKSSGFYGKGFYFSDSESHAGTYGNLYKVYLNIKNPLQQGSETVTRNQVRSYLKEVADNEDYSIENYGTYDIDEILDNIMGKNIAVDAFKVIQDINATAIGDMVEATELFNSINGTTFDGIVAPTETVAFYPEQIKSATDNIGTFDKNNPDIRFSLSESVEETKDLLAVHNLTTEQVLKSLELGGLPMPSVAVVKSNDAHNEYGEISLILPKEAIDPKTNKANKVYGGDAWTPVYPRIEYKPSEKVEKKISDKYYGLAREIGYDAVRPMYNYVTDLERQLNNAGGENAMLEKLYDDTEMMNLYLQDSGKGKIEPIEKETVTEISPEQAEMNQFFIDALGDEVISNYPTPKGESMGLHRRQFVEQYGEDIRAAYKRFFMELYGFTEAEADNAVDNTSKADLLHIVRDAYQYTQNKGVTVKTEIDRQATNEAIRNAAAEGYKEWIDGLFKGVEEKTGIRNNQDYYTRSGNPRSWDALHWENTLENVVKTMKGQEETGTGSLSPYNSFASLAHKRYGSIEEIKADSTRLGKVSQDEYEALGDAFANRFAVIADSIKDPAERNPFIATDNAAELIVDAVRTRKTKSGMLAYLQKWNNRVTEQTVEDIVSLVDDIANMPTGYFEAKPQRAVSFEEVGVFVIPYDADVKLKQELLNRGYSIAEYDPKVEGDRQRVVNQFEELKFSLSNVGEEPVRSSYRATLGKDIALQTDDIAPVAENLTVQGKTQLTEENSTAVPATDMRELFPDDGVSDELENLQAEEAELMGVMEAYAGVGDAEAVNKILPDLEAVQTRIRELQKPDSERIASLDDSDVPPEMEAPYVGESESVTVDNPFDDRDWYKVGNQKVKAYMYENPEVKPFFQEEAMNLLGELSDTQKGERIYNDQLHYDSGGEKGWMGTKRLTSETMETLLDSWGMSYADIEKGLNAIIEDNGAENIAAAKKIEFMLNDRLMNGYKDFYSNGRIPPNQDYINLLNEKQINSYSKEAFDSFMQTADMYAPEDVAPVKPLEKATPDTMDAPIFESKDKNAVKGQTTMFAPEKPKVNPRVANVLTDEAKVAKEKSGIGTKVMAALVDKGWAVEKLSNETGNHELQAKYQAALPSTTEAKAQYFMEHGEGGVKSLKDIKGEVDSTGKTKQFFDYLYHMHNVDRMSLEARFGVPNKAVYGDSITSEMSRATARQYEIANPEFKDMAADIYAYNKHLRNLLVDGGVISQETADLWEKMYPHYVPIRRVDDTGANINVALDTNKTGVNAPVKRATGGSSDIQPLFETMAMRTEQTYRAIARNSFGLELKNTLGSVIESEAGTDIGVDEMIDTIEMQDDLLKPGTMVSNPTFTVFENGERVEFEITEDLFDALKPAGKILGHRNKALTSVSEWRRNLLTTWNPVFALYRNPVKDLQDMAINSQHPVKSYLNIPNAIYQIATNGKWATEYAKNGGKSNTYFDSRTNKFKAEDSVFKKTIGMPLKALENAGEFIEEIPRLAEYIASRQEGRSVERSMLDAARVTTNFAAGGDFTKFLNSHGFTFLNASVQGASQHVRNFREAKQQGLKGYVKVLAKYTIAGLPGILLNNLMWDDDEEYEELNDYVKQNYYVVAKTEDGKFIRIPKGRTAAVMQNAMEQMQHLVTGDDEADFGTFFELFMNNIAPNNPLENNILAPVGQALSNKAWYGGDLVPSRLQKLPAEEQFDESTDAISRWLGEKTGFSPYKINYLIDQYSGGLGDMVLPTLTPEAESGDNSLMGNILAPWKKEMTTDSVLNNRNPGDFYDLRDELEVVSNSKDATEEDKMRNMYMDSVSWEMSDLYAKKREIQSSDLPDNEKYEAVREVQEQINQLANNALDKYNNVRINGAYSEVGDRRYNYDSDKDKWYEIKPTNSDGSDNWYYIQEQLSHDKLGMSYDDFWNGKLPNSEDMTYYGEYNGKRYNYDADKNQWYEIRAKNDDGSDNWYYQMEQEVTKGLGISYEEYWNKPKEYNFAYEKPGQYAVSQAVGGYDSYMEHYDVLHNWQSDNYIGADKDSNGNSISGSRKDKIIDYINDLDLDYGEKIILYRTVYSSKADKRAYNQKIIDYLNERDDISYQQMKSILEELGMKVDSEGYITW